MTIGSTWFETAVADLADPHDQRVWSVIVSLFGDLAQDAGAQLSGGALTRVFEPIGIKPEAIRVALHRLRKDGWIESDRVGRVSMHFLTDHGRAQSASVTPRIYARQPALQQSCHVIIAEDGNSAQVLDKATANYGYCAIGRNIALGSGPPPTPSDGLLSAEISANTVPAWIRDKLYPEDLRLSCQFLRDTLNRVIDARPSEWEPTPAQRATLRTLVIHRWRRVVLRQPDVPAIFFPADWVGPNCRDLVFTLLDTLPRPSLAELNAP